MTTKFSLRLFHTLHGISKQSNLEGISEANLIHPTAQSGAKFRSDWEYFQGGRLHSIAGQLVPLLDHPRHEKKPSFLIFLCFQHRSLQLEVSLSMLIVHTAKNWVHLGSLFLLWHTPQLLSHPDPGIVTVFGWWRQAGCGGEPGG